MDAPDELRQAITDAINAPASSYHGQADAVLAVPAIADALARDAKVAEIVGRWNDDAGLLPTSLMNRIAALYPETGK